MNLGSSVWVLFSLMKYENRLNVIRRYPEAGQPIGRRLRKLVIKRFPYSLIYRWDEQQILILAVAHQRRRPGYWKLRRTAA